MSKKLLFRLVSVDHKQTNHVWMVRPVRRMCVKVRPAISHEEQRRMADGCAIETLQLFLIKHYNVDLMFYAAGDVYEMPLLCRRD